MLYGAIQHLQQQTVAALMTARTVRYASNSGRTELDKFHQPHAAVPLRRVRSDLTVVTNGQAERANWSLFDVYTSVVT